jgi:NAD(P)-dependent dehydrogenase (short-subunit alcohol dehydrogenase family)
VTDAVYLRGRTSNGWVRYDGADLSKQDAIEAMIGKLIAEFGSIDILVNNAGIQFVAPIDEFPVDIPVARATHEGVRAGERSGGAGDVSRQRRGRVHHRRDHSHRRWLDGTINETTRTTPFSRRSMRAAGVRDTGMTH